MVNFGSNPIGDEPMDLTDEQWDVIKPLIPEPPKRPDGRGTWRDNRGVPQWYFVDHAHRCPVERYA